MKRKLGSLILSLVMSVLVSSCYPYTKNPSLTSWPKYNPESPVEVSFAGITPPAADSCSVRAVDLLGAWVSAMSPETDPFPFTDLSGRDCLGTFSEDILPLFIEANLWFSGSPSCRTCHGPDVQVSYARLDLSSYQGILAGSSRDSVDVKGEDILGGGDWQASVLYDVLTKGEMPPSLPAGVNPQGPVLVAGSAK